MPAEQLLLRLGGQIDQQALGNPCRRLRRIKSTFLQRFWPVLAQIDGNLAPLGARLGVQAGEYRALEIEDLGTVQLEDRRPVRPRQPVGAGVQSRRQNDDLPHAGVGGAPEILIEILGTCALEVDEMLAEVGGLELVVGDLAVEHVGSTTADGTAEHLGIRVDGHRVGLLRLQRSRGRYEQRGRSNTRRDVPGIAFTSHPTDGTPMSWAATPTRDDCRPP